MIAGEFDVFTVGEKHHIALCVDCPAQSQTPCNYVVINEITVSYPHSAIIANCSATRCLVVTIHKIAGKKPGNISNVAINIVKNSSTICICVIAYKISLYRLN